jgi:hypothetical protein
MRKRFLRTLIVTAAVQFFVKRTLAGRVVEEGRAERLWMMYPVNVVANALAWTLLLTALSAAFRALRRAF